MFFNSKFLKFYYFFFYSILILHSIQPIRSGFLSNVGDKDTFDALTATEDNMSSLSSSNKVFQGGYWQDLHRILNVSYGDRILYIGSHIYADILRLSFSIHLSLLVNFLLMLSKILYYNKYIYINQYLEI